MSYTTDKVSPATPITKHNLASVLQRLNDPCMTQTLVKFSPYHLVFPCSSVGNQSSQHASHSRESCGFHLNRLLLRYTSQPAIHLPVGCNDDHRA